MSRSDSHQQTVEEVAAQAYAAIAAAFPVCAASDEFYFFPQVVAENRDWRIWDDFSRARIEVFADRLRGWEAFAAALAGTATGAEAIDAALLQATMRTMREQLVEFAPQSSQPSFHLTVVAAGLSEALEADCSVAWADRIAGLPGYLQRATDCLDLVPRLCLVAGRTMADDLLAWLQLLRATGYSVGAAPAAIEQFRNTLSQVKISEDFRLPEGQYETLLRDHLCCGLDSDAVGRELETEKAEMEAVLCREAERLVPGRPWQELEGAIPFVSAPGGNLLDLYHPELVRLENHVFEKQLVPPELRVALAPRLAEVPDYLAVIRASDAYAARPGYPPRGGTFYVFSRDEKRNGNAGRSLEYRMTATHEAWPGHHLLDVCRWSLPRPLRRPLERPLCYEGWACLAEELMAQSGYFDGEWDRFLLARRRIERSARGLVDLGLQSGRMTLADAAQQLMAVGYPPARAEAVVPKYALRPGYQVCYTLGLRRYHDLLQRFAVDEPAAFARTLLRQGQIDFGALEIILTEEGVS